VNNSVPIPFLHDPNNPDIQYHLGFALSSTTRAAIADFEPTIIHLTTPDCSALHLIRYARSKEIPLMGTYHSNIPEYMKHYPGLSWLRLVLGAYIRHQYNFLQKLYVPTPYIQRHLEDCYEMSRVTSMGIWGRGVDIANFNPHKRSIKYRSKFAVSDDCVLLCWVGRLVPEKRPDIFAKVVRKLAARGVNFHAIVVGAGPSEDEVKDLPKTSFCGWMNAEQLAVVYASCDVFLFPSAVETFGNVTLEAAASGLPVVVEAGCSGHLVQGNGFACAAGDVDSFFEACVELIEDPKLRNQCCVASRQMAEKLEKRSVVREMLDNYTCVTDQFFGEFSGTHASRDAAYMKAGSFRAGNHPVPMILTFVENLVVVLFQVIWNMTMFFMSMQDMFASFGLPTIRNLPPLPREETINASLVSFNSSELPNGGFENRSASTSSMVDDDSFISDNSSTTAEPRQPTCCVSEGYSNVPLSHKLATSFIRIVQVQCRVESSCRNAVSACFRPAFQLAAKRKNSVDLAALSTRQRLETPGVELQSLVRTNHRFTRRSVQDV